MFVLRYIVLVLSITVIASCASSPPVKLYEGEDLPASELSFLTIQLPLNPNSSIDPSEKCMMALVTYDENKLKTREYEYVFKPGNHTFSFQIATNQAIGERAIFWHSAGHKYHSPGYKRESKSTTFNTSLNMKKGVRYFVQPTCSDSNIPVHFSILD